MNKVLCDAPSNDDHAKVYVILRGELIGTSSSGEMLIHYPGSQPNSWQKVPSEALLDSAPQTKSPHPEHGGER